MYVKPCLTRVERKRAAISNPVVMLRWIPAMLAVCALGAGGFAQADTERTQSSTETQRWDHRSMCLHRRRRALILRRSSLSVFITARVKMAG